MANVRKKQVDRSSTKDAAKPVEAADPSVWIEGSLRVKVAETVAAEPTEAVEAVDTASVEAAAPETEAEAESADAEEPAPAPESEVEPADEADIAPEPEPEADTEVVTAADPDADDDIAAEGLIVEHAPAKPQRPRCTFTVEDNNIAGTAGTISELHDKQREFFRTGTTIKPDWRKTALGRLHSLIDKYETPLIEAIHLDLGITRYEAYLTELAPVHAEFKVLRKNIEKFCNPGKMGVEKDLLPVSYTESWQPHGTVCIINSWESPVAMSVILMAEALAAGNTVVLKNSGRTKRCNEVLAAALDELFKPEYARFVFGGADMDAVLLTTHFDKFCYVGPRKNARVVREASLDASAPTTMLLDGNNACFVDATANLESAAEKIMWGKMLHAGQTRYTPHFAFVNESVHKTFVNRTFAYIERIYGKDPIRSKGYPRMFSRREFDQACELLGSIGSKAQIIYGGQHDAKTLRIAPTVVLCDSIDNPLFKKQIVGPILVVGAFERPEEAFERINQLPTPPAFYMFSSDKETEQFAMLNVQFGQGCINDCMMQIANRKGAHSATGTAGNGTIGGMRGLEEFGTRRIVASGSDGSSLKGWRKTPFPLEGYDKVKKVFRFFTSQ